MQTISAIADLRALLRLGARACHCALDDPRLANLNTPQLLSQTTAG